MSFSADRIEKNLNTRIIGKTVLIYDSVDSTNEVLKRISADEIYNGLAVFARHQEKGKGRNGRRWLTKPDSSVLCSMLVFFDDSPNMLYGPIMLASAVAPAQAIIKTFAITVGIKWPNDIYYDGKKLGGILIESSPANNGRCVFIIGVGINCRQREEDFAPEIADKACSVAQILNRPVDDEELVRLSRQLLIEMDNRINQVVHKEYRQLRDDWLSLASNRDNEILVMDNEREFRARIVDIDVNDGSLLVQGYDGVIIHLQQNTARII